MFPAISGDRPHTEGSNQTIPGWLSSWTDTADDLIDSEPVTFSIYSKSYTADSQVSLGNNGSSSGCCGYSIIVKESGETTGEHSYISVPTLVLVYKNYRKYSTDPDLTFSLDGSMNLIEDQIVRLREFYWRNSNLTFNMEFKDSTYIIHEIDRDLSLSHFTQYDPGTYMMDGNSVVKDTPTNDYTIFDDIINHPTDPKNPEDFSTIIVLYAWKNTSLAYQTYGGHATGVNKYGYENCTLFIPVINERILFETLEHEYNHLIDFMFQYNGISQYPHVDQLLETAPHAYGQADEINSSVLRHWPVEDWFLQTPWEWGYTCTTADNDMDGVPDNGADRVGNPLAITEDILNSFYNSEDDKNSDTDNLTDFQEVMAHWNDGADPLVEDTDNDGVPDHLDYYPSYSYPYIIPSSSDPVVIDGDINTTPNEHTIFGYYNGDDYTLFTFVDWNDDYLFLSFYLGNSNLITNPYVQQNQFKLILDLNNDGQFHGLDNYLIRFGFDSITTPNKPYITAGRLEEGAMDKTAGWEELSPDDFELKALGVDAARSIELAIPKTAIPELDLVEGQYLSMNLLIRMIDSPVSWEDGRLDGFTGTYEQRFEFIRFILAGNPVGVARFLTNEVEFFHSSLLETNTNTIQIQNWGNNILDITGFTSTNPYFSVENLPLTIGPMETKDIIIGFTPDQYLVEEGSITLEGIVPSIDDISIHATGKGGGDYVSDLPWIDTYTGYATRDIGVNLASLCIGAEGFEKGVGMLVATNDNPAFVTINTGGNYETFYGKLGVTANVSADHYIEFQLLDENDNQVYVSSPMTSPADAEEVNVDIHSVNTLILKASINGPGLGVFEFITWGNAELLINSP